MWGEPVNGTLPKASFDYQIAPLALERKPFDIYMVDGRWRVPCVMVSFLHAIHTGGNLTSTRVIMHDYSNRTFYGLVKSVATIEREEGLGVVLALKNNVTQDDLYNAWEVRSWLKNYCNVHKISTCSVTDTAKDEC